MSQATLPGARKRNDLKVRGIEVGDNAVLRR
jgi:hypothetical protein